VGVLYVNGGFRRDLVYFCNEDLFWRRRVFKWAHILDVILLHFVHRLMKLPKQVLFDGFGTPTCGRPSSEPQKGAVLHDSACFESLCVKIHPRVTSVGEPGKIFSQTFPYDRFAQILGCVFVP